MATYYNNILETIGKTPVVRINKLAPPGVEMFVKIESFNPMASVKDRMALSVIEQAERDLAELRVGIVGGDVGGEATHEGSALELVRELDLLGRQAQAGA